MLNIHTGICIFIHFYTRHENVAHSEHVQEKSMNLLIRSMTASRRKKTSFIITIEASLPLVSPTLNLTMPSRKEMDRGCMIYINLLFFCTKQMEKRSIHMLYYCTDCTWLKYLLFCLKMMLTI